ncbi:hypothetical protein [Sinomonas flava]|uniref:hypothetical protein n=1 Tax=Sinomonas flava TaxID=496857 RepID=UPI0039A4B910
MACRRPLARRPGGALLGGRRGGGLGQRAGDRDGTGEVNRFEAAARQRPHQQAAPHRLGRLGVGHRRVERLFHLLRGGVGDLHPELSGGFPAVTHDGGEEPRALTAQRAHGGRVEVRLRLAQRRPEVEDLAQLLAPAPRQNVHRPRRRRRLGQLRDLLGQEGLALGACPLGPGVPRCGELGQRQGVQFVGDVGQVHGRHHRVSATWTRPSS